MVRPSTGKCSLTKAINKVSVGSSKLFGNASSWDSNNIWSSRVVCISALMKRQGKSAQMIIRLFLQTFLQMMALSRNSLSPNGTAQCKSIDGYITKWPLPLISYHIMFGYFRPLAFSRSFSLWSDSSCHLNQ